jgi:GT2 family glycosyltransferase
MRVSIVIPAFNNWTLTKACTQALFSATAIDIVADVVVVDDGSTDGVTPGWTATQRAFKPVLCPQNRGFSAACNAGAAVSTGEVLLFLNNDAYVRPGSIAAMLDTLAADETIGIVGAKLIYADGSLQHAGLALLDGPVSRWWHVHRQLPGSLPDANVARDLLAVTGAALMVRRSLFETLGGFDDGFVNGWEDVDLCLRSWSRGLRVRYEPRAVIEHLESATLGRTHDDRGNEARFIARWNAALAGAPRYPLAEVPPVALAVARGCAAEDRWALEHVRRWWGTSFGAKVNVTHPGSRLDRAKVELNATLAKRRPTVEISWTDAALAPRTGPLRVAYVAPPASEQARAYAAQRDVTSWWTPTEATRKLLVASGAPHERVAVVPLGAAGGAPGVRAARLVVAAREADSALLRELAGATSRIDVKTLRAGGAPELGDVDLVIARAGGDRWGLFVPAALAHGCRVVTSAPVDAAVSATPGLRLVAAADIVAEVLAWIDAPADLRASAPEIALGAQRRLGALLATQGAAQVARALVHGTPSAALAEVGPALAAGLRRIAVETRS